MAYYIFTVNDIPVSDKVKMDAKVIADTLLAQKIWIFREGTPLLKRLESGDKALIYLCGRNRRCFVAEITFQDKVKPFSGISELEGLAKKLGLVWMSFYIQLEATKVFGKPVNIKSLIPSLSFIIDKKNYGLNLRLPIISIPDKDYKLIAESALSFEGAVVVNGK
ncbi:hypothetical protein [Desulfotomaculum copahuensis]|uniref:EVE domain-containing protein n=1 Tax=Desulfotomaculum copahuensis TaxID=1838280 RepID=A0A1B7LG50_9FIRM|nr:hypothetical protein [Desulfotomaculum copahuensis]OAT84768.1 hypothetical protein A6M21_17440 [Desulfotomaculum copahuensis]